MFNEDFETPISPADEFACRNNYYPILNDKAYPPIVNYDAIFLNHKPLLKEENKFLYGHVTADLSKQMIVAVALATMEQLTRRCQLISLGDSVDQIVSRL